MMDAEKSERAIRKIERLLKAAKLRETQATLERIEFKASRGLDRNTIMTLGECEWLRRRQNVIITGATGAGNREAGRPRKGLSVSAARPQTSLDHFRDVKQALAQSGKPDHCHGRVPLCQFKHCLKRMVRMPH